jgi:hypothetical protein
MPIRCDRELDHAKPPKARVPVLADNDVVVHRNTERARDRDDFLGHFDVRARRRRIATRVVVDQLMQSAIMLI